LFGVEGLVVVKARILEWVSVLKIAVGQIRRVLGNTEDILPTGVKLACTGL